MNLVFYFDFLSKQYRWSQKGRGFRRAIKNTAGSPWVDLSICRRSVLLLRLSLFHRVPSFGIPGHQPQRASLVCRTAGDAVNYPTEMGVVSDLPIVITKGMSVNILSVCYQRVGSLTVCAAISLVDAQKSDIS
jgi:hypothetical protein